MLKPHALLSWLLPCCAAPESDPETLRALLAPGNIGILSAACCDTTAASKDEGLKANLQAAMAEAADARPVVFETITAAQRHLRTLQSDADVAQRRLIGNVVALFQAHGLSIFPLLIVNGRVAFYGGVPSVEMIRSSLQRQPLLAAGA